MVNINDLFPSKYVKASDLKGRDVEVTIRTVEVEKIDEDERPVLYFQGMDKGLVLNRTNANSIAKLHGGEVSKWAGKTITLFPTETDFKGEQVACIRVRTIKQQPVDDGPVGF